MNTELIGKLRTIAEQANNVSKALEKHCCSVELTLAGSTAVEVIQLQLLVAIEEAEKSASDATKTTEALKEANEMCRSAMQIANRDGAETDWDIFRARLGESLVRQHAIIHRN